LSYIILFAIEGFDCGVYVSMFADRLSKDGLSSCSPEDATTNREQLVLSLMERQPLLKYDEPVTINEVEQQEQQTETNRGTGQQSKQDKPDSKDSGSNIKVKAGDDSKESKVETVEVVKTVEEVVETVEVLETVKVETVEAETIVETSGVTVETQGEGGTTKKDWSELKVPALKDVLRVRNLKLSGRKADLVSRLIASDLEIQETENRINARPTS
jgi:hypothetical protein